MQDTIEKLQDFAEKNAFWGSVSVYRNQEKLIELSFGPRDLANHLPNTAETCFGTASGTKSFTSVAIGTLIDQGKLTLDSAVGDLFGEKLSFIDSKANIRQLLNHSSGIFDYFDEELEQDFDNFRVEIPWCDLETPSDYWPLFKGQAMKFQAGERFSYSNGGYVFLGILIERLSGMTYRDYVKRYVLEPAGMPSSGFFAFNELPGNTAWGYIETEKGWKTNIYNIPIRGGGDGGMYTNNPDIRSFWTSLLKGKILKEDTLQHFLMPQNECYPGCHYSLGLYLPGPGTGDTLMMVGGDAGVGFNSCYRVKEGLTLTVLSNKTDGAEAMFYKLVELC